MEKVDVQILVQRDDNNMPFARVLYGSQDAFNLDEDMKKVASYLARKSAISPQTAGLVYVSTEDGTILDDSQIDKQHNFGYCIYGSESGRKCVENLIATIRCGANNKDIEASLFVTDGVTPPIFINEDSISESYQQLDSSTWSEREREKLQLLDSILDEQNISQNKKI